MLAGLDSDTTTTEVVWLNLDTTTSGYSCGTQILPPLSTLAGLRYYNHWVHWLDLDTMLPVTLSKSLHLSLNPFPLVHSRDGNYLVRSQWGHPCFGVILWRIFVNMFFFLPVSSWMSPLLTWAPLPPAASGSGEIGTSNQIIAFLALES